jgi:hypothetical protein
MDAKRATFGPSGLAVMNEQRHRMNLGPKPTMSRGNQIRSVSDSRCPSTCRAGHPLLSAVSGASLEPPASSFQNSNRKICGTYEKLELDATYTKQTPGPISNRKKTAFFIDGFVRFRTPDIMA